MTAALLSLLDLLTQALPGVKGAGVTIKIAVTFALVEVKRTSLGHAEVSAYEGLGAAARQQTKMTQRPALSSALEHSIA